ncbi:MAG: hypothetical protein QF732_11665, partial [Nitrospinaceae bacterium]|nr:hypothetical protein [Nitrospinaceae bacterium]
DEQLAPLLMLGMGSPSKMGFYSPSGKALTTAPGKGTSKQYLAHLKKEPGATKEGKQTGLIQKLEEAPGTLTKEEVVSMWNPIELTETVKGVYPPSGDAYFRENRRNWTPENWSYEIDLAEKAGDFSRAEELNNDWEYQAGQGHGSTKYGNEENLNLPGGTNPKEILVQLPDKAVLPAGYTVEEISPDEWRALSPDGSASFGDTREIAVKRAMAQAGVANNYKSDHWSEPNVLAHIRTNERDVGGKKALHIEEIQSDWHQQGQKKGYFTDKPLEKDIKAWYQGTIEGAEKPWEELSDWEKERKIQYYIATEPKDAVPDAPYKKDWHELAFKRALTEAVNDPSIERLTWTTGDVQADRYNLAKYIDSIEAQAVGDNFNLAVIHKDGHAQNLQNVTPDKLSDYVGKEMAEKIVSDVVAPNYGVVKTSQGYEITVDGVLEGGWYDSEKEAQHAISQYEAGEWDVVAAGKKGSGGKPATYSGLDLEVGGEFHKQLYDKKIVRFAKKFLKKYGVEPKRIS